MAKMKHDYLSTKGPRTDGKDDSNNNKETEAAIESAKDRPNLQANEQESMMKNTLMKIGTA
mgnify:CR=1 FL=1